MSKPATSYPGHMGSVEDLFYFSSTLCWAVFPRRSVLLTCQCFSMFLLAALVAIPVSGAEKVATCWLIALQVHV